MLPIKSVACMLFFVLNFLSSVLGGLFLPFALIIIALGFMAIVLFLV